MTRWPVDPAAVLLGGLDPQERAEAERLVREDPAFRAELERLRRVGAALAVTGSTGDLDPPPLDLEAARAARPVAPARRRRTRRAGGGIVLRPAMALASSIALVAVGALGGTLVAGGGDDTPATEGAPVTLAALDGTARPQRATVAMRGGGMHLDVAGLAPSRAGEHYELWLLNSADDLVSVGTFKVDDKGRVDADFPLGVDASRYAFIDVSVEPDDGNPAHSSRSVLRSSAQRELS
ncbi:hypothetical protein GKE82_12520 [Conexibacter sp. W3-3-2]|uniref:anti-sigma factor n=1 Tax=Conexibacter sp. W3-3-2 TaxID=2675227 RepID=UPI0012B8EBEC|nr:anti-sigma factor [Conexibacter sp. W3-3-2]MTD45093.1 hypothetical protein [Conexibacter sp. W3-3-2]